MNKKKEKEISEYVGLMLWPGFCRRGRQRRRAEGEREQRNGETGNRNEKDKEEKKVGPTE